jgi:hypothetical protein
LHQFSPDWLDMVVQEIRLEVVNTEFKGTQALEE